MFELPSHNFIIKHIENYKGETNWEQRETALKVIRNALSQTEYSYQDSKGNLSTFKVTYYPNGGTLIVWDMPLENENDLRRIIRDLLDVIVVKATQESGMEKGQLIIDYKMFKHVPC